ncbi:MAG: hypothetical protein ACP5NE_02945 [Candidatus Micrarchaeia archaeon]
MVYALGLAMSTLFYFAGILFGISIVKYFLDDEIEDILAKYAFAFPIGFSVSSFIVLAFDAIFHGFGSYMMWLASLIMLAISIFLLLRSKSKSHSMFSLKSFKLQVKREKLFYVLLFIVIAVLIIFQYRGEYYTSRGLWGGDNYGSDFLFHVSIGNSLIYTGWPPKLLYADGAINVFPFIADFYTAMLSFGGIPAVFSLYMMNFLLYFSIVVLFVYLIAMITRHKIAALAGFILFLFCSLGVNMIVLYLFHISLPYLSYSQIAASTSNLLGFLTTPLFNFSNPIGSNFAPQHDLVLGFPMALIILILLYKPFFEKLEKAKNVGQKIGKHTLLYSSLTGLLIGMMPLIHPFSLVFVAIFAAFAFVYSLFSKHRKSIFLYFWLPLLIVALAVGTPQLLFIKSGEFAQGFSGSVLDQPFWSSTSIINAVLLHIYFWFETMGLMLVLGLIGLYYLRKRLIIFIPAFIALALVNFVRFSPSFGDSNKITLYFLLFISASASEVFYAMWKRGCLFKELAVLLFVGTIFTGVIAEYIGLFQGNYLIASNVELNATSWIRTNLPQNSTLVDSCYGTIFGLTSSLGAKKTLIEIQPYISTVGLSDYNVGQVAYQTQNFFKEPNCTFVKEYNISYVFIENMSNFAPAWCDTVNYTAFSNSSNFTLYKSFKSSYTRLFLYKPECG